MAVPIYHSISEKRFLLPENITVYSDHDYNGRTAATIGEEKTFAPYFTGISETQLVRKMAEFNLP